MTISPQLADWIQEAIQRFSSEESDERPYLKYYAARHNALPLYIDWTHSYGLRVDGTVVLFSTDSEEETMQEEGDERLRNFALYVGAQKYPEIAPLVPTRPSDAIDCKYCKGRGRFQVEGIDPNVLVCFCGGLGWVPYRTIYPESES